MKRALVVVCGLPILMGCNQPPRIEEVGPFVIADSITDYLTQQATDSPYFEAYTGETVTFTVVSSDPDEDPIQFSAGPLPLGASFDSDSGEFSWTPDESEAHGGGLELYIVAEDGRGGWDSVVVYLALSTGEPPVYRSIAEM